MYGIDQLKEQITITKDHVECPVKKGHEKLMLPRKRRGDGLSISDITCSEYNIAVRSSTFIYVKKDVQTGEYIPDEEANLLWKDSEDGSLLSNIKKVKRESRMANDNSEDAVTWNIFRYLHNEHLIPDFVKLVTGVREEIEDIMYWSYSHSEKGQWKLLTQAQEKFGEKKNRGSEPDMAIETKKSIIFIEAKFNASNSTTPSNPQESLKKYAERAEFWSKQIFSSTLEEVAIHRKRYELMRFWLLGTWMAKQKNKNFYLVNLLKKGSHEKLEKSFKPHIKENLEVNEKRVTTRLDWEDIYFMLKSKNSLSNKLDHYFKNKSSGYSSKGVIQPAFKV